MLRKLRNRKRGQSTAEYAILIALVVAAVIAMQQYAKRTLQARIYDAARYIVQESSCTTVGLNATSQFEPGFLQTEFTVTRNAEDTEFQNTAKTQGLQYLSNMRIERTGSQNFDYSGATD